jgi:ribosomal protein L11 methyltransferase
MHSVEIACDARERDLLAAALWEEGTLGIEEEDLPDGRVCLRGYFDRPTARAGLWRQEPERDWAAVSRGHWRAVEVGQRFFLAPPWDPTPPPAGRIRLSIEPGRAAGTGYSTPTQLALEALERLVRPGDTVLDAGTGSGILALAASRLGAGRVVACDLDAVALAEARINLGGAALLWCGSPRSVASSSVDVVVANLTAAALRMIAGDLRRLARPDARWIVSGFRLRRAAGMRSLFGGDLSERDGWCCLAGQVAGEFL